jgi:hypothetical protein
VVSAAHFVAVCLLLEGVEGALGVRVKALGRQYGIVVARIQNLYNDSLLKMG